MDLKKAIEILEIEDFISIKIVKENYRKLQKLNHPDVAKDKIKKSIHDLNDAYKTLINYLENFVIPLEILIEKISNEEKLKKRFSNDWVSSKEL